MSWDLDLELPSGEVVEIFMGHTYNLTPMWRLAGVIDSSSSDIDGLPAMVLHVKASAGLLRAVQHPADFKALNPPNGWGDFEGFVKILTRTAVMCAENPGAVVRWSG